MRILGLDPGTNAFGYGCIDVIGSGLKYVECGVLTASADLAIYPRLVQIGQDLESVFSELHPEAVAMEGGFVERLNAALPVGAARGVAAYIAGRRGLPVREYAPSTVKVAAAGHGRATKDQVAALVRVRLKMKTIPVHDAADALAVAICRALDRT